MALLERDDLLAVLRARVAEAADGRGSLVAVSGEAGAGKSSLVRELLDGIAEADVRQGACDALVSPRPLGAVRDMMRDPSTPPGAAALLAELHGPVAVLVVEDAHWADAATLDALRWIGRRVASHPVVLVVTYRDDDCPPGHPWRAVLGDLAGQPALHRLHVPRLSVDAVAALAGPDADAAALHRLTGGNPFFLTELLASGEAGAVPATVSDAVLARAHRLGPQARDALDVVSASPRPVRLPLLADVAGVDEAVTSGVLVAEPGHVRFRHELARLAVYGALPPVRRTTIHHWYLGVLDAHGELSAYLHHADAAGDDEAVLRWGPMAAGRAAALGAHREAAATYALVLRHGSTLSRPGRRDLLERLSYECYLTDRMSEAVRHREEALALTDGSLAQGDALRWLSRLLWFDGRNQEAYVAGRRAVELLDHDPPTHELALACSNLAQLAMLDDDVPATEEWGGRALALAHVLHDDEVRVHALNNVGTARGPAGRHLVERSLRLALEHGWEEHAARAYTNLTGNAGVWREPRTARFAEAGLAYCLERDLDSWWTYISSCLAGYEAATDQWSPAHARAAEVLSRPGSAPISRVGALVVIGRLRARRGDPDPDGPLQEAWRLASGTGERQREVPVLIARAELRWLAGAAGADDEQRAAREAYPVGHPLRSELTAWLARLGDGTAEPAPYAASTYERAVDACSSEDPEELADAARVLLTLGATAALRRVQARQRELGTAIVRGPRPGTRSHPDGLTSREAQVLGLLREGRTNAEIAAALVLSERTVEHHVSAVLRKLGATSRQALLPT